MSFCNRLFNNIPAGLLILSALIALTSGVRVEAAQRLVLFEDFTSTTCPPCASLAPIQEQALADVGEGNYSMAAYHMNWPAPGDDPWNADNRDDLGGSGVNGGRRSYYSVSGVPTLYVDGRELTRSNPNEYSRAGIANAIRTRAQEASPATIAVTARIVGNVLQVQIRVAAESAINTRLYVCLNEQQYHFVPANFPNWTEHYHPTIKMIPNYSGTNVVLGAGESRDYNFEQSMDGLGWHELDPDNLEIVAFLQDSDHNVLQSSVFELGTDIPSISISSWELRDGNEGDGDGRAEPGETADLIFTIENAPNYLPAESITLEVTTDDPYIDMVDGTFELDGLGNGQEANNLNDPIRFRVSDNFVAHPVTFNVVISAQPGDVVTDDEITFMVDWPVFLLIDAADDGNATNAMFNLFGVAPLPWCDRWDRTDDGYVPEELLYNYVAIIWHAFNNHDPITEFEADMLVCYLDHGGTLVISGSHIPEVIGNHPLFTDYLGVHVDNPETDVTWVHGVAGDPHFDGANLFLGSGNSAGWPDAKPSFAPQGDANGVLFYYDSGNNAGFAGVAHTTATYAALALAFPIESVGGAVRTDSRSSFVNRIYSWVLDNSASIGDEPVAPERFILESAYPNPFNPNASLRFHLPFAAPVTLKIFNIAGQEVASLLDGMSSSGWHTFSFNAADFGLGAGLYYARLASGGQVQTTKLLYLK